MNRNERILFELETIFITNQSALTTNINLHLDNNRKFNKQRRKQHQCFK